MKDDDIVIIGACRTAIGSFNGVTAFTPATDLGSVVINDLIEKSGIDPSILDEVIMGQVLTADVGQNPARQASIKAGIPETVPSYTINKVCGSGIKSIALAAQAIRSGDAEIIIAGGEENMSLAPHVLPHSRSGQRLNGWELDDSAIVDGLEDVFNHYHMGVTAENLVEKYNISREEQDAVAYNSQMRAKKAIEEGHFDDEIVPVKILQKKKDPIIFKQDEHPRFDTTVEKLSKLPAIFKKGGSVTAGNATGMNNAAAAVIVTTRKKAKELGIKPLCKIVSFAAVGVDPRIMGIGPVYASRKCLEKANWNVEDLDLIEANEVFAAQGIAVNREMGWDKDKVNINGSALALGHPIGATGARIIVTLIYSMIRENAKKGIATLCIGGGMGFAMAIERDDN